MFVKKLDASPPTLYMISRLLYEPHIYKGQDDRMRDVWGVHVFFTEIENGERLVWGAFSKEDNSFLGCVHGTIENNNFIAHTMFKRHVDAVKACLMMVEDLKIYCKENDISVNAIVGYPPEHLRIAIIMNKKFGCKDMGRAEGVEYWRNGVNMPCRYMRKEI
jgi:hypothetical protein